MGQVEKLASDTYRQENRMNKIAVSLLLLTLITVWGVDGLTAGCREFPPDLCALVYDDGNCQGWELEIPVGEIQFNWYNPVYYWYRNDIEQVTVRAGCSFTGYDDSSYNGGHFVLTAGSTDRTVELRREADYRAFDESIQSLRCTCN